MPASFGSNAVLNHHVALLSGWLCLVDQPIYYKTETTGFWMIGYRVREFWTLGQDLQLNFDTYTCNAMVEVLSLLAEDEFR